MKQNRTKKGFFILVCVGVTLCVFSAPTFGEDSNQEGLKFKGDLRVRHQIEDHDLVGGPQRSRGRIRTRLGLEAGINQNATFYGGLASGGDDPRSTNQSFQDSFSTKGVQLDYAYAKIAMDDKDLLAGKMKNPLWRVSDLMWDSDIRPEGVALKTELKGVKLTSSYFVLDEQEGTYYDPYLVAFQGVKEWGVNETMSLDTGFTFYGGNNLKSKGKLDESSSTNTLTNNKYNQDFSIVSVGSQLNMSDMMGSERVSLMVDYLQNSGAAKDNAGYLVGVKFGNIKVKKSGDWQASIQYRNLEKDATLDILPDSDSFGGKTGIKGWELIASYGIAKNTKLTVDYYLSELIEKPTDVTKADTKHLVQVDLSVKF